MKNKIGFNFGHQVDFSLLHYTPQQVQGFENAAQEIEKFFTLPINDENFNAVINIWHRLISVLPLLLISVDAKFIVRSRRSKEGEIFEDEADVSYNSKCPQHINPGRFNRPQEAVFYGTLPSDKQAKFLAAASIESYKDLISDDNTTDVIYYHFGKFNVQQQFPVINLCIEPRVLSLHPGLNNQVQRNLHEMRSNLPESSFMAIFRFWLYVSRLVSQRKLCEQHYMVTTALYCVIRYYYESKTNELVNGIIYPSPMVYADAINIALMPHAVDKYLLLDDCFIFKYIRGLENKKYFDTDICSKPSKAKAGKLNITDVVWGRQPANYGI